MDVGGGERKQSEVFSSNNNNPFSSLLLLLFASLSLSPLSGSLPSKLIVITTISVNTLKST